METPALHADDDTRPSSSSSVFEPESQNHDEGDSDDPRIRQLRDRLSHLERKYKSKSRDLEEQRKTNYLTQQRLADVSEINAELSQAKEVLSAEIMDLTKVLFEEANGMVANEVRARVNLENARRKLQEELELTKDRLRLETQQLGELRTRLHQLSMEATIPASIEALLEERPTLKGIKSPFEEESLFANLSYHYFDDLFPERRCDSKLKRGGTEGHTWGDIIRGIDESCFDSFARFLDRCADLDDSAFLSHPFMKKCFDCDVVPCLQFDFKPRTLLKKVVMAMLANTCAIDRVSPTSPSAQAMKPPSRPQSSIISMNNLSHNDLFEPVDDHTATSSIYSGPLDVRPSSPASVASASTHSNTYADTKMRLRGLVSQFALSVSSLPDMYTGLHLASENGSPQHKNGSEERSRFCALCGGAQKIGSDETALPYQFRLTDTDPLLLIDSSCRDRLVAAGDFYTFIRHLRKGLFVHRAIIDLYFELLHYKRNMFYARSGGTSFFIHSDFDQFLRKVMASRHVLRHPNLISPKLEASQALLVGKTSTSSASGTRSSVAITDAHSSIDYEAFIDDIGEDSHHASNTEEP